MLAEAMKVTAIYDKYDVNEYLMGAGLSVTPEYRGLGIAVELLRARYVLTVLSGIINYLRSSCSRVPNACVTD